MKSVGTNLGHGQCIMAERGVLQRQALVLPHLLQAAQRLVHLQHQLRRQLQSRGRLAAPASQPSLRGTSQPRCRWAQSVDCGPLGHSRDA
jgi:hypothetical protein